MSQAVFTHDTELSLRAAAALVNTPAPETLDAVIAFFESWGWTGPRPENAAVVPVVGRVRQRIAGLWGAPMEVAVDITNGLLRDAHACPQLVNHEPVGWHIHAAPPESDFPTRLAVDTAMAFADAIRTGEYSRLRRCAAADCDDAFVDLSKNRSRKFCDGTCGTKAAAAAYRARARESVSQD